MQFAFSTSPSKEPKAHGSCPKNLLSHNSGEQKSKMMAPLGLFPSETENGWMTLICKDNFLTVSVSFSLHVYVSVVIDPLYKDTLHCELDSS